MQSQQEGAIKKNLSSCSFHESRRYQCLAITKYATPNHLFYKFLGDAHYSNHDPYKAVRAYLAAIENGPDESIMFTYLDLAVHIFTMYLETEWRTFLLEAFYSEIEIDESMANKFLWKRLAEAPTEITRLQHMCTIEPLHFISQYLNGRTETRTIIPPTLFTGSISIRDSECGVSCRVAEACDLGFTWPRVQRER
jgi:hypothetical protein